MEKRIINGGVCKRPWNATKQKGLVLRDWGMNDAEIGRLWGITRQRVGVFLGCRHKKTAIIE